MEERASKRWYLTRKYGGEIDPGSRLLEAAQLAKEIAEAQYATFEETVAGVQDVLDRLSKLPPLAFQADEIRIRKALANLILIGRTLMTFEDVEIRLPTRRPRGLYI